MVACRKMQEEALQHKVCFVLPTTLDFNVKPTTPLKIDELIVESYVEAASPILGCLWDDRGEGDVGGVGEVSSDCGVGAYDIEGSLWFLYSLMHSEA